MTSSSDQAAIVWDAITGRPKFQITGHQGPDGGRKLRVFPGGNDRTKVHSDDVTSAAFSPDGRWVATASTDGAYIVTASRDGTARIYNTQPWWVYSLATQRITRKLTHEERGQYSVTRKLTDEEKAYYQNAGGPGGK